VCALYIHINTQTYRNAFTERERGGERGKRERESERESAFARERRKEREGKKR